MLNNSSTEDMAESMSTMEILEDIKRSMKRMATPSFTPADQMSEQDIAVSKEEKSPRLIKRQLVYSTEASKVTYITGKLKETERLLQQSYTQIKEQSYLNSKLQEELLKRNQ